MAEGILALLAKKKPGGDDGDSSDDDDGGEPSSVKARAVRDMFRAAKDEDWEAASEAFHRAYVECKRKASDEAEGDDDGDESEDSDYKDEE